ncbi:MAG: superinfection immunity protein [Opitutaceae bacterium]
MDKKDIWPGTFDLNDGNADTGNRNPVSGSRSAESKVASESGSLFAALLGTLVISCILVVLISAVVMAIENPSRLMEIAATVVIPAIAVIVSIVLYFLPAGIAIRRSHRNDLAIFVLNLFLGWTFLGWVVALVWAFTNDVRK